MKKPKQAVALLVRVPVMELINTIRKNFETGNWSSDDVKWLLGQAQAAAMMREVIEEWYECWDDEYDGQPLKDYEYKMLKILGKE